ncbi:MAG: hypothetical protein AAB492_03505 [Patescibacteria group bacterium]
MAVNLNRAYHGLQIVHQTEKNQKNLQRRLGVAWRDTSLTSVAISEASHDLTPEERADLLIKLEAQNKFLRRIEVD